MEFKLKSISPEQTAEIGEALGRCLRGGDVLALYGGLGAGKTALAQGVARALGVAGPVVSPTFTLMHEYQGMAAGVPVRLIHMDLYRLQHPEEAEVIGVEDAFQSDAVCLIEWPEIAAVLLPEKRLEIRIEGNGDLPRILHFSAQAPGWEKKLERFSRDRNDRA